MNDSFVFPVNFQDVQQDNYSNRHCVQQLVVPAFEKHIYDELDRINRDITRNPTQIISHQNFDFLYHLIKVYNQNIEARSMRILQILSQTVLGAGNSIIKQINRMQSQTQIQQLRIRFKMIMFLILYFVTAVAKCKSKTSQADLITQAINKQKKRKNKGGDIELSKDVIYNMKRLIQLIKNTLQIDYKILWERKQVDPQLFKRETDVCVKILQSNIAKDQQVIQQIFSILQVIIKQKAQLFMNIQRVLINLVYESQMTDTLVNFFSRAQSPQLQRLCTQTIICVVVYLVAKNLNNQASSIKNTKQFLSRLSQKIPKVFYNNLSCFIRLYLHQSYHLRNAISDILMNILRYVLNNESDQSLNKARQKFINTLIQRIYDKSSFCRWHVLGILNQLTLEKAVPKKYTIMFLKAGVDRIKDTSVNTRKKALQLINTIIQDVWPEDKKLRSLSTLKQQIQVIIMNKQTAQKQLQEIKNKIDGEDFEDDDHLNKLTKDINILNKKIYEYDKKLNQFAQQQQVVTLIQDVLDKVKILLCSRTDTDVLETIRLFIKFYKRNIQYCKQCLPNIRLLIFSKQKKIKDQVLNTFTQLHLLFPTTQQISNQLINLFKQASPQDYSALQQILQIIISQSIAKNIPIIKLSVFADLWYKFIQYERSQNIQRVPDKRSILTILRIAFNNDPSMIKQQNIVSFLGILKEYISRKKQDFYILREILKIIMLEPKTSIIIDNNARNLLLAIVCILVNSQQNPDQDWYSVSEHLLTCIHKISPNPQKLTQVFIKKLHQNIKISQINTASSIAISHFIFTLSHSCLKMLIHLDSLQNKIKNIRISDDNQEKQKDKKNKNIKNQQDQDDLDKVVGGLEAEIEIKVAEIQKLGQKIIQDPFIYRWVKIVQKISNEVQIGNELQIICVLSYCKFMCISSQYCKQQFPNLLKILNKTNIDSVIKNNIIIAIGDLIHRFQNTVTPYIQCLFSNLHNKDIRVRKTTLTVLTHLILNDVIKPKDYVCDIAMLFQDQDIQIQCLVKQFFSQMKSKDQNLLYNMIPAALKRFSEGYQIGSVSNLTNQKTFTIFFENILPLMEKQKNLQSLIQKLCGTLASSQIQLNLLLARNAAFCLSQLNMNEKGLRILIDLFPKIKNTLQVQEVSNYFKNLVNKLKKNSKTQIKTLAEELQQHVLNSKQDVFNADEVRKRNQRNQKKQPKKKGLTAMNKKKGSSSKEQLDQNTQSRKKKGGKRFKKAQSSEQQSEIDVDDESQQSQGREVPVQSQNSQSQSRTMRPRRAAANNRKPIIVEEDSQNQYDENQDDS